MATFPYGAAVRTSPDTEASSPERVMARRVAPDRTHPGGPTLRKLGARSRTHVVVVAYAAGLIDLDPNRLA